MLNKVEIIGHLGRDPEVRYLPSGDAVCNFSVATTERWKDKTSGERQEATSWHRCVAFGKLAEVISEYLKKGSKGYFGGKLKYGSYEKDGVTHYTTDIQVNEMVMLDGKPEGGGGERQERAPAAAPRAPQGRAPAASPKPAAGFDDMDDDIPF